MELKFANGESHEQVTTLAKEHETFLKEADERDLAIRQQVAIKGCLINPLGESRISDLRPGGSTRYLLKSLDKLIIFNTFARELLPVDAVWSPSSFIYEELTDIFEESKHGFDSKSRTLTHFVAFEEHMVDKCLAKPSRSLVLQLAILGVCMRRSNYDSATVNNSVFIE